MFVWRLIVVSTISKSTACIYPLIAIVRIGNWIGEMEMMGLSLFQPKMMVPTTISKCTSKLPANCKFVCSRPFVLCTHSRRADQLRKIFFFWDTGWCYKVVVVVVETYLNAFTFLSQIRRQLYEVTTLPICMYVWWHDCIILQDHSDHNNLAYNVKSVVLNPKTVWACQP
jgi:hypothetical protein